MTETLAGKGTALFIFYNIVQKQKRILLLSCQTQPHTSPDPQKIIENSVCNLLETFGRRLKSLHDLTSSPKDGQMNHPTSM